MMAAHLRYHHAQNKVSPRVGRLNPYWPLSRTIGHVAMTARKGSRLTIGILSYLSELA